MSALPCLRLRSEAGFVLRGLLSHLPWYERRLKRRARTGGTDDARYCYSVWLRHQVRLRQLGVREAARAVAELGPGDSIGVGLAALLSGAERYVALDVFPYSDRERWTRILDELSALFEARARIPDNREFPELRPALHGYDYPLDLLPANAPDAQHRRLLREELGRPDSRRVRYVCPWNSPAEVEAGSIDLIWSQAVMEHVMDLDGAYAAMFQWLRRGGCASHVIDFRSHGVSWAWNGHWRYAPAVWSLLTARREFTMNRRPLSHHLAGVRQAGFEIVHRGVEERTDGLPRRALARPFRDLADDDLKASGVHLVLRKP